MNTIFWVGDSTVQYNDITTYPQTGIGQVFALYCKPEWQIRDYAKNGKSSKSFYDGGLFEQAEKEMSTGDYLFIQFGHNDEKRKADRFTDPMSSFQEYLMRYVDAARKAGAIPVLITPLSRRRFISEHTIEDSHGGYPQAVLDLAAREHLCCVDLTSSSKELLECTGEMESRQWFMYFPAGVYENYMDGLEDNTHLHYSGAVKMAGLIAKELKGCTEFILDYQNNGI